MLRSTMLPVARSAPSSPAPVEDLAGEYEASRRIGAAVGILMTMHDMTYAAATDHLLDLSRERGQSPLRIALQITDRATA